jgi:hypothetical protein
VTYYPPPPPPGYGPYQPAPQYWQPPADPLISPDYSGWFSRGVAIAKRGWKQLAGLQLIGLVVVVALSLPFLIYIGRTQTQFQQEIQTTPGQPPNLSPFFALFAFEALAIGVGLIITSTVTLATVHISVSVAMGLPARVSDALSLAARRVFPLIGWQLLAIPIYLLGVCVCVLPVFYVAAVFSVLPAVVAVERTNVIGRCFTLFNRNVGLSVSRIATIFGLGFAAGVVAFIVSLVVRGILGSSLTGTAPVGATVVSTVLSAVVSAGIAVLTAPLIVAAYADMRSRVEPINTATIAGQLGIIQLPPQQPWPYGMPSI